ncbi:MAG: undecaprenyl-diphosphate phosphatase [Pirellulales bacterium]
MNDQVAAAILGIVEGLTEFLPVSSTAHIRLVQGLLSQDLESDYWKMFAVVIQLGAILSVVVYFFRRLMNFVSSFFTSMRAGNRRHPLILVLISFIVTAGPCFLIEKLIDETLENMFVISAALIIGGIAMWWIDRRFSLQPATTQVEDMTVKQAVVIGLVQILAAAFPGTSRSMATIAGGQLMGLSRSAALEYSFFLSIPVMAAATGYKLLKFMMNSPTGMTGDAWLTLAVGFAVSFVTALIVIAWFMQWVRKHGFAPFAVYRVVLGLIVLAAAIYGWGR